jgi:predicted RNA binding protein YcfA (HicA-like mRNA interferase family)
MSSTITFATLDKVLQALGFVSTEVPGSHVAYEHPASGAVLVLRLHPGEEPVDQASLVVVRRTLVEKGVIDRARLDDLLGERSMAG